MISIGINHLTTYTGSPDTFIGAVSRMIKITIDSGRIFTGLFYLPLGCFLAKKRPNLEVSLAMFVSGYILNVFVQNSYFDSYFLAISSIGFFCVISALSLPNSWVYLIFRKTSTIIYLIHMYIWTFYYMLKYGEKTMGLDCFMATVIICLVVSLASIIVMEWSSKKKIIKG